MSRLQPDGNWCSRCRREYGRDLVKPVRNQLLELVRPMFESIIYEVTGVKVLSLHHGISTINGEEVVIFTLAS